MVKVGDRFINKVKRKIRHIETKWGQPIGMSEELHAGKFIVDWIEDDHVHLSDADWDDKTGNITFHSSKWGHILLLKDLKKLSKVSKRMKKGK